MVQGDCFEIVFQKTNGSVPTCIEGRLACAAHIPARLDSKKQFVHGLPVLNVFLIKGEVGEVCRVICATANHRNGGET